MEKVYKVIKFDQNTWPKAYINMKKYWRDCTDIRKIVSNNDFEKDIFKFMNNGDFGKTMENVRKLRDIKLIKTERRRNYLVSEPIIILQSFSLAKDMKISRDIYEWINLSI